MKDQVVLITGASGGIGSAIASALAAEGVRLFLVDRAPERLTVPGEVFQADLTDDVQLRAAAGRVREIYGGVDVLIHSIGLFRAGPIETAPVEDLDAQYRVNLRVPYLLTQELLPSLIERRGQVVFLNSSAGSHPAKGSWGAYSATKHALRAVADSLRDEVNGSARPHRLPRPHRHPHAGRGAPLRRQALRPRPLPPARGRRRRDRPHPPPAAHRGADRPAHPSDAGVRGLPGGVRVLVRRALNSFRVPLLRPGMSST